jgi:hypothetical protein
MVEAINRYTIPVPEWCRIIWASADARAMWVPRIQRIHAAWNSAERLSVGHFRAACRQNVSPENMPAISLRVAEAGRTLLVLGQNAQTTTYAAGPSQYVPGDKWDYNVVIAETPAAAKAFALATKNNDDATLGDLLGFPPCCMKFFADTWVKEKWLDTTWPMSLHTTGLAGGSSNFGRSLEFTGVTPYNNILLRWLGVRLVPHLPCSHDCVGTTAFGKRFGEILQKIYPEEFGWMMALLSARLQWSANKGIAEIATPILKISTKTDAMTAKVIVRLNGGDLEAQARGVMFPWKITNIPPSITPMPLVLHKDEPTYDATVHLFNGFKTLDAMEKSHSVIREFYKKHFEEKAKLLDLGCGNGSLASSLSSDAEGVEADLSRAHAAGSRLSVYATTIIAFMRSTTDFYDVALISAERLAEMSEMDREYALDWLQSNTEATVLYTYSDGNLEQICKRLNLAYGDLESRDATQVARLVQ